MEKETMMRKKHTDHETVAFFVVQLPFVLTILNLHFQPRVSVAIQFLPQGFHDFIFPGDSCLSPLNVLNDSIVIYKYRGEMWV